MDSAVEKENCNPNSAKKAKCWPACIKINFFLDGHEYIIKEHVQNSTGEWTGKYSCSHARVKTNRCCATISMKVDANARQRLVLGSHEHTCKQHVPVVHQIVAVLDIKAEMK